MKIFQICSSVFLIFCFYAIGHADEHFPFLAQVTKESVNIRAGANTNFEIVDKLNKGAELVVLAKSFDWYKVQLPISARSYIREDYLKVLSHSIAQVIGNNVNIRVAANSESTSLGQVKKGEYVRVITQMNGWWQIEPPAQAYGWIRQDFINLKTKHVAADLMRLPLQGPGQVPVKGASPNAIDVKGRLIPITAQVDTRYELQINGKAAYYVQNIPNIDRFKGAMVLIKGIVSSDNRYDHPMLRTINISLLL
jgi:SH3-like domain-containing protein